MLKQLVLAEKDEFYCTIKHRKQCRYLYLPANPDLSFFTIYFCKQLFRKNEKRTSEQVELANSNYIVTTQLQQQ